MNHSLQTVRKQLIKNKLKNNNTQLRTTRHQQDKAIPLRPGVLSIKIINLNRSSPKQKKNVVKPHGHKMHILPSSPEFDMKSPQKRLLPEDAHGNSYQSYLYIGGQSFIDSFNSHFCTTPLSLPLSITNTLQSFSHCS